MLEEDILMLESQGYSYNRNGYIVDSNGEYVKSVQLGGKTIYSELDFESFKEDKAEAAIVKSRGFEFNPNIPETEYKQRQKFMASDNLQRYIKEPDKEILDKDNPQLSAAFKQAQKEGYVQEYTLDALESNANQTSKDAIIQELSTIVPENINTLKEVRQKLSEIEAVDDDVDSIMKSIINEEDEEYVPEEGENSVVTWLKDPKKNIFTRFGDWMWEGIYSGVANVASTGAGMDNENLKETYKELKAREKELITPAVKSKIRKEQESIEQIEAKQKQWLEENSDLIQGGSIHIPYLSNALGNEYENLEYMKDKKKARLEELEDYLSHENQNWFMRNLWNPFANTAKGSLKDITWAETAHNLNSVLGAANRFNEGKATEQDKIILEDYADQLEFEDFKGQLPSLGGWHDTTAGVTHSLGFMAEMTIGGGFMKKGGKEGAEILGKKYLDDAIVKAINAIGRTVPPSVKPVVKTTLKGAVNLTDEVIGASVVPLGMSSTYSGMFETLHPIVRTEDGKMLMDQDAYQYEMSNLTGQYMASQKLIDELSAMPNLTEQQKQDLKQAMSFVGINEEIHGVKRNKAIPTYNEITKDLEPMSGFDAFYRNYTQQYSEVLSERVGQLGIGKALGNTKVGRALLDNKAGRFVTEASERVNKLSGGHVHSIFDEMIEENLVPVFNYAFQGKESELYSMMNLDAQKDVAIQTVAMNMLFRVPGVIQDNFTQAGRENKKWRKKQANINKQEKERLSGLYRSIANLGVGEDLSKIIDLTSIPGSSNQKTQAAIRILDLEGKTEEAAKLRNSLFDQNAVAAIRTGTTREFKAALEKIQKNPEIDVPTRTAVANAINTIDTFKDYQEKYQNKFATNQIVENLMNRDIVKKELKATEAERTQTMLNNKEEFDTFERNFEKRYKKFIADRSSNNAPNTEALDVDGPQETMTSGIGYLNKRFEDPKVQADYAKLLMESAKSFSPELQTVVNKTAAKENALRASIETQDRLHIELTSAKKQAELRAKELLKNKLYSKYLKDKKSLTPEEMDILLGEEKDIIKGLSKEDIADIKDTVIENISTINVQKQKAKREASAKAAAETLEKNNITPKVEATPKVTANSKPDEAESRDVADIAAMLESGQLTSGGPTPEGQEDVQPFSRREYGLEPLKPTYRGTSLEEWENIQSGQIASSDNMQNATWVSDKKEYSEEYVKSKENAVLIEFKPEAIDKSTVESGQENDNTGVRIGRNLKLEDVQKVTDSKGNILYEADTTQPFSSREFNPEKITDAQKESIINTTNAYADSMERELGRAPSFEDMIKDRIERAGFESTDEIYNTLKYMWELSGRDISKAGEVYNTYFNAATNFDNLAETISLGAIEENAQIAEEAIETSSKTTQFDERNQPVVKDGTFSKDGRTTSSKSKAAHLGIQYKDVKNEDGTVTKIPVLPQLNESQQITNHDILNSDYIKEGISLDIRVPENVNETSVANWKFVDNQWVKSEIKFGDWVTKNNVEVGSTEYNNKVPMIAYYNDKPVFFIHDTDWYNTSNVGVGKKSEVDNLSAEERKELSENGNDFQKLTIKKGIKNISNIRANVLNGNNRINIEERRFGSVFNLTDLETNNQPITLNEATGDTKLAVAKNTNQLVDSSSSGDSVLNNNMELVNNFDKTPFIPGHIYEIRHVNTKKDGTKQYLALRVLTNNRHNLEELNNIAFNNVKFSVISSILLNNQSNKVLLNALEKDYGMTLSKAQNIHKAIKEDSKIDIQFEIGDYISMFAKVEDFNSNMIKKLEDTSLNPTTGQTKYPNDTNYISVDNNIIKIALKNGQPVPRNAKGYDKLPGIPVTNVNENNVNIVIGLLHKHFNSESGDFRKTAFDVSRKQLNKNNNFSIISDTGVITKFESKHGDSSYEGYVKDTVKTNVKSFAIQDEKGETKWITDVQPMIYFDLIKPIEALSLTREEKIQRATQQTLDDITPVQEESIQKAIEELPDDLKQQLGNFNIGDIEDDIAYSRREFNEEITTQLDNITDNTISSLTPLEQKKLVNSLFNLILGDTELNNSTVSLKDIATRIDSSLETYLAPKILEMKTYTGNLKKLENPTIQPLIDKFESRIEKLETVVQERDKIISKGESSPKGDLYKKFERFLSEELTGTEDLIENDNGEMEFSFNASSLEKDVKLSFSNALKIFFSNVKKQKRNTKEDVKNFAQLNDYESVDDVKDYLTDVMVELPSSIDDLISILESKKEDPIYNQILNKIKNAPEGLQNEILYKMIQSKLDMYMVLYSFNNQDKTYSLKIINPNSSATDIKLKKQWYTNFRNSDLFKTIQEERFYNRDTTQALLDKIDALNKVKKLDSSHEPIVKELLNSLGIDLKDNVVTALVEREGKNILSKGGILGVFNRSLMKILSSKGDISLAEEKNNPFTNARGVLEKLIALETELNGTKVAKSFRVDGKSIQGAIQKMMIYDIKEDLRKPESNYFQALKQIAYSKGNYILNLIQNNEKFRNNFDVGFISLEAIKEHGKKKYGDRKINKLAETDNMLTQYAFFQNTLREIEVPESNLSFRMGQMFNPALSDKEQMLVYSTALVDLSYKDFNINKDLVLNDEVVSFLTSQIFDAEFDRIINTYINPTDIKNYDNAAKRFISMPEFNKIKSAEGANIHDVIQNLNLENSEEIALAKEIFRKAAETVIRDNIKADVDNKVNKEWINNGFITETPKDIEINYFDTKYLKSKKGKNTTLTNKQVAQIAAYDFVVNQYLNQNNVYQLMAGDMALYAPSIGKFTNRDTGEINDLAFTKAIGESISKRMAMLIAPGNKLANSNNDKYVQLMVEDPIKITSSAKELIKQYYGTVSEQNNKNLIALDRVENQIQKLYLDKPNNKFFDKHLDTYNEIRDNILNTLKKENPEIGGYFDIEGTDAQEYTTWKEHIDTLFRQGRLSSEEEVTLKSAYNKLLKGEEITGQELSVVMNPVKPVYAGSNIYRDKEGKPSVNRIVYIKSSSFPLLPQLTKDFKLDAIRKQMESLEKKEGRNVRLSYQTANKVGAIDTKLTTNDLYNIPFEELYNSKLKSSMLVLDRNNFKIQQDTPYKTEKFLKKNSEDMTTMGSQMWKIILGNGINKIEAKIFPHLFGDELVAAINRKVGRKIIPEKGMISGKDLDTIKFHTEKMYFDIQKELLFDELGINSETRTPNNLNETIRLLHDLLERETTTRQYPEGIIDNLRLVQQDGNLEFLLPIWLSNGSNKFESLLQSIITNRLIQINLPGNQHISSSSEGFEKVVADSDTDLSKVVWIDPNHTGELKATRTEDGQLKEAEILVQSKFRKTYMENGKPKTKLIDLTQAPYSTNGVLNTDMIEDELLSSFSFRIPTSSHQSGAILKVVGFLPEASGDMLVVPKEHTQQIGEDFDIDKRTLYKSNYNVDEETGAITKINYSENKNAYDRIMEAMLGDDYDPTLSYNTDKRKELKAKVKMLENAMIDVYKSVYQSPNKDIQKKINKILSFDNASDTANIINNRVNSSSDDKHFTLYSDTYQRQQMKLGADGKTGIGAHSNAVTFQAQMERLDNNLILQEPVYNNEGKLAGYANKNIRIGKYTSDGILGRIETLDGSRTIGDIHTENQNSSTDNIKAQIMGKRNENPYTMNVLTQLTYRGFDMVKFTPRNDKHPDALQISSLFISQPILRRYVELKEKSKSITASFDTDSEQTILETLVTEFGGNLEIIRDENGKLDKKKLINPSIYESASSRMTGDTLYDNLLVSTSESDIQMAVLQTFFTLENEAKHLGKYQSLINLSTSGLGISYFNVLDRIQSINDMGYEESIANIRDLVGEFIHVEDFQENTPENADEFTRIGDFFIKPTTTEGTVLVQSVSSAEDIMDISFPYKEAYISNTINKIIEDKGKELGKARKAELQYKVVDSIRDYLYAVENIGLYEGDINSERKRLFFDTKENQSLASFLKNLKDFKNHPIMQSNELLKSLIFDGIQRNGAPSIIKHQTDFNTNFDKTDKYNSFLELMQDNKTNLGEFNGELMTPRKLAQDLASYAYLANNENGAIGFRDFIHTRYLEITGVSDNIRNMSSSKKGYSMSNIMNNFEKQFYQHNPEEAKILSPTNISINAFSAVDEKSNTLRNKIKDEPDKIKREGLMKAFLLNLEEFSLREEGPEFISIRNTNIKLSDNQYNLYQWNGSKYVRIPVLGTFGFNEYNPKNLNQASLIYPEVGNNLNFKPLVTPVIDETVDVKALFDTSNGVVSLLEQINISPEYKKIADSIAPYVDSTTKVVIDNVSTQHGELKTAMYRKSDNTIYISPRLVNTLINSGVDLNDVPEVLEEVILEEIIHSITVSQLDKFGTFKNGVYTANSDAPIFINKLVALYDIAAKEFPYNIDKNENYYTKDIYEFTAGVFVSEELKEKLDNTKIDGKTLLDRFKDAISSMIRFLSTGTYSSEVRNAVYELLDYTKNTTEVLTEGSQIINNSDISAFNKYLNKSNGELPSQFFTPNTRFKEFFNPNTGKREKAPQSSSWELNENNLYDLIDQDTGEIYITNVDLKTGIQYNSKQIVSEMKKEDVDIDAELDKVIKVKPTLPTLDVNNIKQASEYSENTSKLLTNNFDKGEIITVTPSNKRDKNSPEYKYVADLIDYIETTNNIKITPTNILDYVEISNIDENTQTIKKKIDLGNFMDSGLFSSGGDSYSRNEVRLPEIKKCK